jgi:hypothetical protein
MATLQQVMDALTAQIRTVVTPLAIPYVCYAGWVSQEALKYEVASQGAQAGTWVKGRAHITVYDTDAEANTSRFFPEWDTITPPVVGLAVTTAQGVMTFAGTPATGLNIGVTVGNRFAIPYQTGAGDTTLALVAQNVAAAINAASQPGVSAIATGSSVAVLGGNVSIAIGGTATIGAEFSRSEKQFLITIWAPSDAARQSLEAAIRPMLDSLLWIPLGDGQDGRVRYVKTKNYEPQFSAAVYRRDILYAVEFASVVTTTATQIVGFQITHGQLPPT